MGIEVIPVSGLSAKKPPSELSKCRMIKPPMCKAFRKAPPSTAPCTCSLFPGPTLSTLEPLVTIGSWCHHMGWHPPRPAIISRPSSWGLSVCLLRWGAGWPGWPPTLHFLPGPCTVVAHQTLTERLVCTFSSFVSQQLPLPEKWDGDFRCI